MPRSVEEFHARAYLWAVVEAIQKENQTLVLARVDARRVEAILLLPGAKQVRVRAGSWPELMRRLATQMSLEVLA
jgi:hypothetical protein